MYYLRDGLKSPSLAWIYALVAGVAALTTTPFTQPNSIALVLHTVVGIPKLVSGIVIAVLTWVVIIGGIKSIGRAAEKLSPLKVGLYLIGGLIVIIVNRARMSSVFAMILDGAFSMNAVAGGSLGMFVAMRYGIARGIYANEAGYGTAAVAYGTARSAQPVQQGLNAIMEVFIVSFVTSTISAMTISPDGCLAERDDVERRGRGSVQQRHAGRRRLHRRVLCLPVRLHDAHRLGVLRRAVPRVHPRSQSDDAVPVDLLSADSFWRDGSGQSGVGLGRSDERAPGVSESDWRCRAERARRESGKRTPADGAPFDSVPALSRPRWRASYSRRGDRSAICTPTWRSLWK